MRRILILLKGDWMGLELSAGQLNGTQSVWFKLSGGMLSAGFEMLNNSHEKAQKAQKAVLVPGHKIGGLPSRDFLCFLCLFVAILKPALNGLSISE
jgi:hypothetical protein